IARRWVYTVKVNPDGPVACLKVCGIDYSDAFFSSCKACFCPFQASHHWHLHLLDVKNAFLNVDLQEEIYKEHHLGLLLRGTVIEEIIVGYCNMLQKLGFGQFSQMHYSLNFHATILVTNVTSEYHVMAQATYELISMPTKLTCDNQVAIHIASNPVFHEITNHIEATREQLVDIFTKALDKNRINYILTYLSCPVLYGKNPSPPCSLPPIPSPTSTAPPSSPPAATYAIVSSSLSDTPSTPLTPTFALSSSPSFPSLSISTSPISTPLTPSLPGFEAILLTLYTVETKSRSGKPHSSPSLTSPTPFISNPNSGSNPPNDPPSLTSSSTPKSPTCSPGPSLISANFGVITLWSSKITTDMVSDDDARFVGQDDGSSDDEGML
ncbi:hypothetical protein CR513_60842, partial [Mucuna pruriens]